MHRPVGIRAAGQHTHERHIRTHLVLCGSVCSAYHACLACLQCCRPVLFCVMGCLPIALRSSCMWRQLQLPVSCKSLSFLLQSYMLVDRTAMLSKCSAVTLLLLAVDWSCSNSLPAKVGWVCAAEWRMVGGVAVARVSGSFGAAVYVCGCRFFAQILAFLSFELQPDSLMFARLSVAACTRLCLGLVLLPVCVLSVYVC
jgi:hypothetical protein